MSGLGLFKTVINEVIEEDKKHDGHETLQSNIYLRPIESFGATSQRPASVQRTKKSTDGRFGNVLTKLKSLPSLNN